MQSLPTRHWSSAIPAAADINADLLAEKYRKTGRHGIPESAGPIWCGLSVLDGGCPGFFLRLRLWRRRDRRKRREI